MIEFSLDGRSGVSPYLQVVQQVRQALRLGLLREGDQLPTVKDVVAPAGDQPEHGAQGLPRAGARGPRRRPPGRRHLRHADADRRLAGRPRAAAPGPAAAGWPRPGWPASTRRASRRCSRARFAHAQQEHSVTAVLRAERPGQALPAPLGAVGLHAGDPAPATSPGWSAPTAPARPRCCNLAVGLLAPTAGTIEVLRRPPGRRRGAAGQGRLRRPGHADVRRASRVADHLRLGRRT